MGAVRGFRVGSEMGVGVSVWDRLSPCFSNAEVATQKEIVFNTKRFRGVCQMANLGRRVFGAGLQLL